MSSSEILLTYIRKLGHPLKEIRERSLQLLLAKFRLGWQLEDELAGTRELWEALLSWFCLPDHSMQQDALQLLLTIVKTEAGTYIVKEYGVQKVLYNLNEIKDTIKGEAIEIFQDVIETLKFLNTVVSEDNVNVPPLALNYERSSKSDSSCGFYNISPNGQSSNDTFFNEDVNTGREIVAKSSDGVTVLLFPWVDLCASDSKTITLVEDALKLLKSTRRCCRFIRDVFLRDFPAEIFLNRPTIVQSLLTISDGGHSGRPVEALHVLLCITKSMSSRLWQLSSLELIHDTNKINQHCQESVDTLSKTELESLTGDMSPRSSVDDHLLALKQLPGPIYALDTLHIILSMMAKSIAYTDTEEKCEVLDLKELNTCFSLVESLIDLLLDCVTEEFWSAEHSSKTHRDIAHKSCMAMRLLGDLLMKYRKSYTDDTFNYQHRVAWLRLVFCAEKIFNWSRNSAMPPSTLVLALQKAQFDPAIELLYPELSRRIARSLQRAKISRDQGYKTKYKELTKLFFCMEDTAKFMKNINSLRNSKKVLGFIQNSLPLLELHVNEGYLVDVSEILLYKLKDFDCNDDDWSTARSVTLNLMAHHIEWVRCKFYKQMNEMVKTVVVEEAENQEELEKCVNLLCDVGVLTEICCHGLTSKCKEIEMCASDIMLYLLRGRLVLSDSCWWRLLASILPVLPLLHVFAAHDTALGQSICKSLEPDIAECMGVSLAEVTAGLVRLLFIRCPPVQMDAAYTLCRLLDDERYLPPRETLRPDILINALNRVQQQEFNVDFDSSPSKIPQTTGLLQILDVLKQDIVLDEHGTDFVTRATSQPALEPSLRRSTLQQLSVMMRHQDLHEAFLQCNGLRLIVALLRMSLLVDDFLAFPECAISCVSVLNSVCFVSRHSLAKIRDLPALLIRVILVFPANDSAVLMSAQILALVVWSGFALQELDTARKRVPALPLSITQRTTLPFVVNSYWNTSPNSEHSSVEWLLSDEECKASIRVHWWCAWESINKVLRGAPCPPVPLAIQPTPKDLESFRSACPTYSSMKFLLSLENATSHRQVIDALNILESYTYLVTNSSTKKEYGALPWQHMHRFLSAPPASSRDTALLLNLLHFIMTYMDNVPKEATMSWIKNLFIGVDASIITLLNRNEIYPQQTAQDQIELTQLHIHIVKVILKCIVLLEKYEQYDSGQLESLVKILLSCLKNIDLKNFHMLGFLNELVRCIRYTVNSRYCKLNEDTLVYCLKLMTSTLSGCASGGGRKGQACRLDALLTIVALLRQINEHSIPVQRWSEAWDSDVVHALVNCSGGARAELRAAALHVMAALAYHAQVLPQLMQAISEDSLSQFATSKFCDVREANVVRAAAAALLVAITSRASQQTDVLEVDVLGQFKVNNVMENCLDILIDLCNVQKYDNYLEPNVPISVLERRSELEVRSQKCGDVRVSPAPLQLAKRAPPTGALVIAIADVLHNAIVFPNFPVQQWNDGGVYRLMFKCISWSSSNKLEVYLVRAALCRAIYAATIHKCVRVTLATTNDCIHSLLEILTYLDEDDGTSELIAAHTQALLLLGSLICEKPATDTIWRALREKYAPPFLQTILQCLQSNEKDLIDAGLFCFTILMQTVSAKKQETKDSRAHSIDNVKSMTENGKKDMLGSGDSARSDCQPDYAMEELCKLLIQMYQTLLTESFLPSHEDRWNRVCSCLSSVLSVSPRGRLYSLHRSLPQVLLATLRAVRDKLSLQGNAECIKSASNNPLLRTLFWLLTVMNGQMIECNSAKEVFAEENLAASLNRLWPWCMLTEQLRDAVMRLLLTFSNDCAKAWSAMSSCISGRCLTSEVCSLLTRETSLASRPRPDTLLLLCLRTLRHVVHHHQCRNIIIKNEVITNMYKVRVRERSGSACGVQWARLCEAACRHADGAGGLLAARPLPAAATLRAALLPALAHVARHRRAAVLQSHDLLELLSGTLIAGDVGEMVSAARAVWALAANNHRAKLLLRSAGIVAAVQSALQRLQKMTNDDSAQRALQLLMYTNTVLQTT